MARSQDGGGYSRPAKLEGDDSGEYLPLRVNASGQLLTTSAGGAGGGLTDAQLRASPVPVQDDFPDGEVLAEQSGANAVLTFTFSAAVNLVVVESSGEDLVSRADPFGGTPTGALGVPCRHEVPTYLPVIATTVKVWAPTGAAVNVYGFRR